MAATNIDSVDSAKALDALDTRSELYGLEQPSTSSPPTSLLERIPGVRALNRWRDERALPNPGTMEGLFREVNMTHLSGYFFEGARAELSKNLSISPAFQVSHTFQLGPAGGMMGPSGGNKYQFGALYASAAGTFDQDGTLSGRANYGWPTASGKTKDTSKLNLQLPMSATGMSQVIFEHDHIGRDNSLNVKAINPSPEGSGMYAASILQSLSRNVAVGAEAMFARSPTGESEIALTYAAKLAGLDWTASAQYQPQPMAPFGPLQLAYHQRLAERVEAAVDVQVAPGMRPGERRAIATAGVKYDLRAAQFRGQLDSTGKVAMLLEQRIAAAVTLILGGEIDHVRSSSRWGMGIQLESSSPGLEEQAAGPPPPM